MKKSFALTLLVVAALFFSGQRIEAQTETGSSESRFDIESKDLKSDSPAMKGIKPERASRHRLPRYYTTVVTQKQRDDIYAIQDKYLPLIDLLTARLEKLRAEMVEKTQAVLTDEQVRKVEAATEEARIRRTTTRDE